MKKSIKNFLSEITPSEWARIILLIMGILACILLSIWSCNILSNQTTCMNVYVDPETGVNYIKIDNGHWMPRYDSDGNIMVTITTEEAE